MRKLCVYDQEEVRWYSLSEVVARAPVEFRVETSL
jgi:hypothetical protein